MTMSQQAFDERCRMLYEEEMKTEARQFYLSFAEAKPPKGRGFLGGAVVTAHGILTAVDLTHRIGINPGGEVLCLPVPEGRVPDEYCNRLLTKDEVERLPKVTVHDGH